MVVMGSTAFMVWLMWLLHASSPSVHAPCTSWIDALPSTAQQAALLHAARLPSASAPQRDKLLPTLGALLEAEVNSTPAAALRAMAHLRSSRADWEQHRCVWASSQQSYAPLLQAGFLRANEWEVRYARVGENASLAASAAAEEWLVTSLPPRGETNEEGACSAAHLAVVHHILPESKLGANISEANARAAAYEALQDRGVAVMVEDEEVNGTGRCDMVRERESRAIAHPNRTDYVFNFSCLGDGFALEATGAEARFGVHVGAGELGPLVLSVRRFVKIPEEWYRNDKTRSEICQAMQLAARVVLLLGLAQAAVCGMLAWSDGKGAANGMLGRTFRKTALCFFLLSCALAANKMPSFHFSLATSQPYSNQLVKHFGATAVRLILQTCLLALAALSLVAPSNAPPQHDLGATDALRLTAGAGAGVCLRALSSLFTVHLSDSSYQPKVVDAAQWMGASLPLSLLLTNLIVCSTRVLLGSLTSRALHVLTPTGCSRLWMLASPRAWLLCLAAAWLMRTRDQDDGAACAEIHNFHLTLVLLACTLLLLQLACFHHHRQLVPVAAAAHQLMELGALLAQDDSAHSHMAQLGVLGVATAVVVLCARLCAALAAGTSCEKEE